MFGSTVAPKAAVTDDLTLTRLQDSRGMVPALLRRKQTVGLLSLTDPRGWVAIHDRKSPFEAHYYVTQLLRLCNGVRGSGGTDLRGHLSRAARGEPRAGDNCSPVDTQGLSLNKGASSAGSGSSTTQKDSAPRGRAACHRDRAGACREQSQPPTHRLGQDAKNVPPLKTCRVTHISSSTGGVNPGSEPQETFR